MTFTAFMTGSGAATGASEPKPRLSASFCRSAQLPNPLRRYNLTIVTFPQHERKPSIEELLTLSRNGAVSAAEFDARLTHFYPELTPAKVERIWREHVAVLTWDVREKERELRFFEEACRTPVSISIRKRGGSTH
jgi:hypothetical protein